MTVAAPVTLDNPYLDIQVGTATATDISCHLRNVTLDNDHATADVETFCNPGAEKPKKPKWTATFELLQSFGTNGLWDTLRPLAGQQVTMHLRPDSSAASDTNPTATWSCYVPYLGFLDAGIGESSPMTLDFSVLGQPVFTTT